jgi:hypothetical protein
LKDSTPKYGKLAMKKIKHSKFKNTGILFELLVRQITSDTLNNVSESQAGKIIRKFFHKNSPLSKELSLYQTIIKEKFNSETKASSLIEACLTARKKLNQKQLVNEKYNLIKEIKLNWDLNEFFNTRVSNYKVLASVYNLFEYDVTDNPKSMVNNKYTLIEHITFNKSDKQDKVKEKDTIIESLSKETSDIRNLTYKILTEKFNQKYSKNLSISQKNLLKKYITNVSNTTQLKEFVSSECLKLNKGLTELNKKVSDKVTKIKLTEVVKLLTKLTESKNVKDEHILALMKYYDLANELKKVVN